MPNETQPVYYIENKNSGADTKLGTVLYDLFTSCRKNFDELVILCIGSDRITGDSLGPLVGHSLSKMPLKFTCIYGTLAQPVHALNLNKTISMLKNRHPHSLMIAIDASLGTKSHVGFLTVSKGALEPGLGVHKSLPPVGDISITGIVNIAGAFDHFLLQSTRLATVVQMADSIVSGILLAHRQYFGPRLFPAGPFFQLPSERTRSFTKFTPLSAAAASSLPKGRT